MSDKTLQEHHEEVGRLRKAPFLTRVGAKRLFAAYDAERKARLRAKLLIQWEPTDD